MASLITLAGFSHQATCGSQGAVGEPPRDVVSTALGSGCLQAQSSLACISEQDTWEGMVSVPGRARHRNSGAHGLMSRCLTCCVAIVSGPFRSSVSSSLGLGRTGERVFKALAPSSHSHNYDDEARCLCILTAALGGRQVQCDPPTLQMRKLMVGQERDTPSPFGPWCCAPATEMPGNACGFQEWFSPLPQSS